jgi:hypothetical protein
MLTIILNNLYLINYSIVLHKIILHSYEMAIKNLNKYIFSKLFMKLWFTLVNYSWNYDLL